MKRSFFLKLIVPILTLLGWNMSVLAQTIFPVPNVPGCRGVSGVIVNMRGGAGGSSNSSGTSFPNGGAGGFGGSIVCTLDVITPTVITSLTYYVGQAGAVGTPVLTGLGGSAGGVGYGTGGGGGTFAGPSGSVGTNCPGGGGGGSSAVLNTAGGVELFVAAGGGGGGALMTSLRGGNGGNPGTAGANAGTYNYGGAGGTPGAGGAAGGVGLNNNGLPAGPLPLGNGGTGGMGLQGSQSGGGGGAGWGGGGGGGAGNLPGVGSTIGVNTATGAGGGGSNYVAPTTVTTGLANGTASVTGNGAVTLTLFPAAIGGTCTSLCPGATTTFTETTPGGVWSSSNATIASVSSTTGSPITVTAGTSAGSATISYTDPGSGYYAFVVVTVLTAAAPITGPVNVCQGNTITLSDSVPGGTWSTANTSIATVTNTTGVVTGVSAGNATITYTSPGGCPATYTISVTTQPDPIAGVTVCAGSPIVLSSATLGGDWSSNNSSVATIDPVTGSGTGVSAGTATVTYSFGGTCYTTTVVTVNAIPDIIRVDSLNPLTCGGLGSIILNGLASGTYTVEYYYNGTLASTLTATADPLTIPGLDTGSYTYISATNVATGCRSDSVATSLANPPTPPPPVISSNQPICNLKTLLLTATDAMAGGTYSWTGPNGFTSDIQSPSIVGFTGANVGIYTVKYTLANCVSQPSSENVTIYSLSLANVTLNQTIFYGGSIQLNAENAVYYTWMPDDGTISNPNINNPLIAPLTTTTYTVYGMDQNGCIDTASVTITVDSNMSVGIPSAFTPNGDGLNDVFRPVGIKFQRLVDFRVYNRWGQQVFYSNNISNGWDGTSNGVPQDLGVYYYQIIVAKPGDMGENTSYKGNVTLVR